MTIQHKSVLRDAVSLLRSVCDFRKEFKRWSSMFCNCWIYSNLRPCCPSHLTCHHAIARYCQYFYRIRHEKLALEARYRGLGIHENTNKRESGRLHFVSKLVFFEQYLIIREPVAQLLGYIESLTCTVAACSLFFPPKMKQYQSRNRMQIQQSGFCHFWSLLDRGFCTDPCSLFHSSWFEICCVKDYARDLPLLTQVCLIAT